MSWDRGAPSLIVPNPKQGRKELDEAAKWKCDGCGNFNPALSTRCTDCSMLQKEEREIRMRARTMQGVGRGGGYFERDETEKKSEDGDVHKVKGGVDIYGRIRTEPTLPSGGDNTSADAGLHKRSAPGTKSDKQKAALERLRARQNKRTELSPPRPSHFREKSSRSRSRERKRESKVLRNHG